MLPCLVKDSPEHSERNEQDEDPIQTKKHFHILDHLISILLLGRVKPVLRLNIPAALACNTLEYDIDVLGKESIRMSDCVVRFANTNDDSSNHHQHCWNSKRKRVAVIFIKAMNISEKRTQDHGDQAAQVDTHVEDVEEALKLEILVRQNKLVSSKGSNNI